MTTEEQARRDSTTALSSPRLATRLGHGFTDEPAARTMHAEFAAAVIDPRHVLVDPPSTTVAVADLIATERARGVLGYVIPG